MILPDELFQTKHKTFKAQVLEFITLKDYKCVEIEARVGRIMNKITKKRIEFHINHPIIFNSCPSEFFFESGVNGEKDFNRLKEAIVKGKELVPMVDKITVCNNIRKIEAFDDKKQSVGDTQSAPKYQRKEKIKTIDIYLPELKYDVRVSASFEFEAQAKDFDVRRSLFSRIRRRESLKVGPFSFDFTVISKPNDPASKIWEVELEIRDCEEGLDDFANIVFGLPLLRN